MRDAIQTLKDLHDQAWLSLSIEAGQGSNPFRLMQVATIGLDGFPKVRAIVLRSVDQALHTLIPIDALRSLQRSSASNTFP